MYVHTWVGFVDVRVCRTLGKETSPGKQTVMTMLYMRSFGVTSVRHNHLSPWGDQRAPGNQPYIWG